MSHLKIYFDREYVDKTIDKTKDRHQLNKMLRNLKNGDIIYCESISRLRRSLKDLIEIKDIFSISYNNSLFSCCLALFDSNKKYLGVTSGFIDWLNTGVYKHNTKVEYVAIIVLLVVPVV